MQLRIYLGIWKIIYAIVRIRMIINAFIVAFVAKKMHNEKLKFLKKKIIKSNTTLASLFKTYFLLLEKFNKKKT